MKIAVVGTGYVGLVTGTCFAELGNQVTCIDIDQAKVEKMKNGKIPIYEPDLETLFQRNIHDKRLSFTTKLSEGIEEADIIFLALPTPPGEDGSADLSYILGVADDLGKELQHYAVIVDKSTVPVGTAERVSEHIAKHATVEFDVVSNPEFLREGFAVADFMKPDRVVIGSSSKKAQTKMETLYRPFVRQGSPIICMDVRSAEMAKYAANAFLATKISFINEIANLCERTGADVDAVRQGIGSDARIGNRFLFPGIGYGGSCFPKDVLALHKIAIQHDYDFKILTAISEVNSTQKLRLVNKLLDYFKGNIEGKKIALWGLSFKPDTDDIREAASLEVIKEVLEAGATITAFDPEATENVKKHFGELPGLSFVTNQYHALDGADALLMATEWAEFKTPDFGKMKKAMKNPVIIDGRNIYDIEAMRDQDFYYESMGRGVVHAKG